MSFLNATNIISINRAFIVVILFSLAVPSFSEEVILNPGYVIGDVRVGNVLLNNFTVNATSTTEASSANPLNTNSYTLIVNVSNSSVKKFVVNSTAFSDNNRDRLHFNAKNVDVRAFESVRADFVVEPGFISGKVSIAGEEIKRGSLRAFLKDNSGAYSFAETDFYADGSFNFPVQPNENIELSGNVETVRGAIYTISKKVINVYQSQVTTHDINLSNDDGGLGKMVGVLDIPGQKVDKYIVRGSSFQTAQGKSYSANKTVLTSGSYSLDLNAAIWTVYADAYLNNTDDILTIPNGYFKQYISMLSDVEVINGNSVNAALLNGKVMLSGSVSSDAIRGGTVTAIGVNNTPTAYGKSKDRMSVGGAFDLVLTEGDWSVYQLSLTLQDSTIVDPVNLNVMQYPAATSFIKNDVVQSDIHMSMGSLTVNFKNLGSQLISSPTLYSNCTKKDDAGKLAYRYVGNVVSLVKEAVSPQVKTVGLPADCLMYAQASVGGSLTTFAQFSTVINAGADVVTDIGAPTLNLLSPEPELFVTDSILTVNGTVSDASGIASILVDGTSVDFQSSNNPVDAKEVVFSTQIMLSEGKNKVSVSVTDADGNTLVETRNVYLDDLDPVINWVPQSGINVESETIVVSGVVTDDVGVSRVLVNGVEVALESTSNLIDPNEIRFSTMLTLVEGDNHITVSALDTVDRLVSETRTVTFGHANHAPVANAGADVSIECSALKTRVNLNASASTDVDGNALSYTWKGSFGSLQGVSPTVLLAVGEYLVDLYVDDGIDFSNDKMMVLVKDTKAPYINVAPIKTMEATSIEGSAYALDVKVYDDCGSASFIAIPEMDYYPVGSSVVLINAVDGSKNVSSVNLTINVVDTTAPSLFVPTDLTVNAAGPLTVVALGEARATDIFDVTITNDMPVEGLPVGEHVVTWIATDANGNSTSATQLVTVVQSYALCDGGFMPPLVAGNVYSNRKALPVKFRVCNSNGGVISDAITTLSLRRLGDFCGHANVLAMNQNNVGSMFRLLNTMYFYNLDISSVDAGDYQLAINVNGGALGVIDITIKGDANADDKKGKDTKKVKRNKADRRGRDAVASR
jgi:hypothetical protein